MLTYEIVFLLLRKGCSQQDCLVHERNHCRHGIPEKTADSACYIQSGPFQLRKGNRLQTLHIETSFFPDGPNAHEIKKFCYALSVTSHIGTGPENHANIFRILSFFPDITGNNLITQFFPYRPGRFGRKLSGIDTIEINSCRKEGYTTGMR